MKRFISVWIPDWQIARLRRDEPAAMPDDHPFALTGPSKTHLGEAAEVVTACNAAARCTGIVPGQDLADAMQLLPGLITRAAEPKKDRAALLALAAWAGRYGPRTNIDGVDGFWIDWPAAGKDTGQEALVLEDLKRRLTEFGFTALIAVADTYGAAFALARSGTGEGHRPVHSMRGGAEMALARLPVETLRISMPAMAMLKRAGLKRIGQLYDIARSAFLAQFPSREAAETVLLRLDQALGLAEEPLRALCDPIFAPSTPHIAEMTKPRDLPRHTPRISWAVTRRVLISCP